MKFEAQFLLLMGEREEEIHGYEPDGEVPGCTLFRYADGTLHTHGPNAISEIRAILTTPEGHRWGAYGRCVNKGCEATAHNIHAAGPCPWVSPEKPAHPSYHCVPAAISSR